MALAGGSAMARACENNSHPSGAHMKHVLVIVTLVLGTLSANAALHSRAGGQAYYDDVLDITWVADANLADTTSFDVLAINANGTMYWDQANEWISAMNAAAYLGKSDWRLPTVTDTGSSGCNAAFTGTDCGYNVDLATGEMAHMFYSTLGNTAYFNTSGGVTGCPGSPSYCLTNTGPFSNLQPYNYWSGTQYAPTASLAWNLNFRTGNQLNSPKSDVFYAWPVRAGDIGDIGMDSDNDGLLDDVDNCTLVANPNQCDSDADGYGNRCDADMNNNGFTNAQDTGLFRQQLGQPSVGPTFNKADLNCNGAVNAQDTGLFRQLLGLPPGPSGLVP